MKICLLADAIVPPLTGIGRYAWALAERLHEAEIVDELSLISYTGRHSLDALRARVVGTPDALAVGDDRGDGIDWKITANARARAWLINWRVVSAAYTLTQELTCQYHLSRIEPDVVHGPNYHLTQRLPKRCASVVTIHDLSTVVAPHWHPTERVARMDALLPKSLARADRIIVDAGHCAATLTEHFAISPDRISIIPLGIDRQWLSAPLQGGGARAYTLCVSTIEPRKNIDTLLSAYATLPRELRDAYPLCLVGEAGWRSAETHTRVRKYQREGWLRYEGYVTDSRLRALYSGARLCVYPSLYEGFGLPVLEAFATGCPLIAGNHSSLPEVAGGLATLLDDVTDVDALREALVAELTSPWRDEAAGARRAYAGQFSWDRTVSKTLAAYQKAFSDHVR